MSRKWFSVILVFTLVVGFDISESIRCYYCHQTSKECNYGSVNSIHQKNCHTDKCTTMKYETPMPGRNVLATIRDCAHYSAGELLEKSSRHSKDPVKIIFYEECSTSLCNISDRIKLNNYLLHLYSLVIILVFVFY